MPQTVLVTGGAGYIGSHTCIELLEAGHDVIVIDNFSNSSESAIDAIAKISGRSVDLVKADLRETDVLDRIFAERRVDAVLHFAALKAVGESVPHALRYYSNNVTALCSLLDAMTRADVRKIVFSSSCMVYGLPDHLPITEDLPLRPQNPYGHTKAMCEQILRDVAASDPSWCVSILRYFNPVGAHPSGDLGEDPRGIPNNLMPFIMQVAVGRQPRLRVFGDDYPTRDGTCIRDYIHVVDLARGHMAALDELEQKAGLFCYNLGTGKGTTVFGILRAANRAVGRDIDFEVVGRRPGDLAPELYADPSRARLALGWEATKSVDDMCADHWRWQSKHPWGFGDDREASRG